MDFLAQVIGFLSSGGWLFRISDLGPLGQGRTRPWARAGPEAGRSVLPAPGPYSAPIPRWCGRGSSRCRTIAGRGRTCPWAAFSSNSHWHREFIQACLEGLNWLVLFAGIWSEPLPSPAASLGAGPSACRTRATCCPARVRAHGPPYAFL